MVEFIKKVDSAKVDQEYLHWNIDCPDYPQKGKDSVLIFKVRPAHVNLCPKCIELDKSKRNESSRPS